MKTLLLSAAILMASTSLTAQNQPVKPELSNSESFSMLVFPDTQSYVKFDVNQPLLELMTAWAANSVERLNIKSILCTGDMVEHNELRVPVGEGGNQTSEQQWQSVSDAFERLDNKASYVLATGNHDYGYKSAENRMCRIHEYFPVERNLEWNKSLVAVANNYEGVPTLENAAYEYSTATWGDILVLSLEYLPRHEVIDWAKKLVSSDKYKDHRVILLTHAYMNGDKSLMTGGEMKHLGSGNHGKDVWEKLIYPSSNIRMVVCGHYANLEGYEKNVSFRTDDNSAGKSVSQMMFNAQTADGAWSGNGGDGWLRILEFLPDGETINVRTFSPFFAISPLSADKAWRTGSHDEFVIKMEK